MYMKSPAEACNCPECRKKRNGWKCSTCGLVGDRKKLDSCRRAHLIYIETFKACVEYR